MSSDVEHDEIIEFLKKTENKTIEKKEVEILKDVENKEIIKDFDLSDYDKILKNSIVKIEDFKNNGLGEDFHEISKELTKDENTFRFSDTNKRTMPYDVLLATIQEVPNFPHNIKQRYTFIKVSRFNMAIYRSAIKSRQADRFKDIVSSLLGFKGMIEYRKAGVSNPLNEDDSKHSVMDNIKKI